MEKSSVLKRTLTIIGLVLLSIMVIGMLFWFLLYKESFDRPMWEQMLMAFCFLAVSANNFKEKKYFLGWIFAGAVIVFAVSIFWTITI